MRKLLATTAMCLVMTTGFGGIASATETSITSNYDAAFFIEANTKLTTLTPELCFYKGDFQKVARTAVTTDMYSGMGSCLMVSVRALRD